MMVKSFCSIFSHTHEYFEEVKRAHCVRKVEKREEINNNLTSSFLLVILHLLHVIRLFFKTNSENDENLCFFFAELSSFSISVMKNLIKSRIMNE